MMEDWNDCAKNDIEMHETVNKAKISNRIINAIMILHTVSPILYSVSIILANVNVTDYMVELSYIYKMKISFSINTQCTYKVMLIEELMHFVMCSWYLGTLNALLLIWVSYTQKYVQLINAHTHACNTSPYSAYSVYSMYNTFMF